MSALYRQLEQQYQLPAGWLSVIERAEGSGDTTVSPKGAVGRFQFMPDTARRFGLTDPTDPVQSAVAAAKYSRALSDKFGGDPSLMLAGYNAGEGAVQKYGGVPPYRETQRYVQRGLGLLRRFADAIIPAAGAAEHDPLDAVAEKYRLDAKPQQQTADPLDAVAEKYRLDAKPQQQTADPLDAVAEKYSMPKESQAETEPPQPTQQPTPRPSSYKGRAVNNETGPSAAGAMGQGFVDRLKGIGTAVQQAYAQGGIVAPEDPNPLPEGYAEQYEQQVIRPRLQRIKQEAEPYRQAHPGYYGVGGFGADLATSLPWLLAGQPELVPGKGVWPLAKSLGTRFFADALTGAGTGAQQATLTPVDTSRGDYGQQKLNMLADAVESGAIAGPVADAVLLGGAATLGGVRKAVNWLTGERAPLSQEALDAADRAGIGLTAFDRSGNRILLNAETASRYLPGGGNIDAQYQQNAQKAMDAARAAQSGTPIEESGQRVAQEIAGNRAARNTEQQAAVSQFANRFDTGVPVDEGVQAGLKRQLEENRQKIRDAYNLVQQILVKEGKQNSPIALTATQQAANDLLGALSPDAWKSLANPGLKSQLEKIAAGTRGGDSLMSALEGGGQRSLPASMTFSEMQRLDRNLSALYGKAKRATGGIGSAEEQAFTQLRLSLQQDAESWAKTIGSPRAMRALQDANQAYRNLKVPYSKQGVPGVNTVVSNGTADKAYSTLFNPSMPDRAAQAFPLLDDAGQKSAKYGTIATILKAATAKGEFDPQAFLTAARQQQPLMQKTFNPRELKAFGDLVEHIGTMPANPALEKAAQAAIDKADPSSFMTAFSNSAKSDAPVKALMSKLSPDGKQAVGDWIIDSAYRNAADEVGNRLSLAKYATFLKQHQAALEMAGRWDGVKGMVQLFDRIQRVSEATSPGIPATGVRVASLYAVGEFVRSLLGAIGVGSPGGAAMVVGGYGVNKAVSKLLTTPGGYEKLAWIGRKSGSAADRAILDPAWQKSILTRLSRLTAVAGATDAATRTGSQ